MGNEITRYWADKSVDNLDTLPTVLSSVILRLLMNFKSLVNNYQ